MTKTQKILFALVVILPIILGCLQFIDKDLIDNADDDVRKHLYNFGYKHRLAISLIGGAIVSFAAVFKDLFAPRKQFKDIRTLIMKTMMDDLFDGQKERVRITIFKDARWLHVLFIYYKEFFLHPVIWVKERKIRPARPKRGKYILVSQRVGTENPRSRTCFYYSPKTIKESQGIAGKVRQKEGELVATNLPDISNIDLHKINLNDSSAKDTASVKEYMRLGHMDDIEALKRLHTKARHFYGNVLYNKDGDPKGVLVIDDTRERNPFDDITVTKLAHYLKLFSPTM